MNASTSIAHLHKSHNPTHIRTQLKLTYVARSGHPVEQIRFGVQKGAYVMKN